ncbi:MAG: glucose-6-phosphate dehydrogenase [Bryobacteraceae bacterium]
MIAGRLATQEPAPVPPPAPAGPCVMVIFGATGDLTKRLLMPSLYNLAKQKLLPDNFAIIGFARPDSGGDDGFRKKIQDDLLEFGCEPARDAAMDWLIERLYYMSAGFDEPDAYQQLKTRLEEMDARHATGGNYLFYFAIAPEFFLEVPRQLSRAGLLREEEGKWRRIIIEKPFGSDVSSARQLNRHLLELLAERQIYRIDHYLGKETVQNIIVFRFANGIFEPLWNRRYIDHVQITVAETVSVEQRGGYYDKAGALRDMIPNHLLQLLSLTAMESPLSFSAEALRHKQDEALMALQPIAPQDIAARVVRGQYGAGEVDSKPVVAYREAPQVAPGSSTETFVALKLVIDNWRWAGVPFYLRTGKSMAKRTSEIVIQFRRAPYSLFRDTPVDKLDPNRMVLQIQPNDGIRLSFEAKVPGPHVQLGTVEMKFAYLDYFGNQCRTGYETLLYDAMIGDATLFKSGPAIEEGWAIVQPILDAWAEAKPTDLANYAAGSWGPEASEELLRRDGRSWVNS